MAAGLGFKDFVTGEVLTAADVDGYLMQGIWVFDDAAARDAAVTSPQEGNACYLKDTNEVLTYSGSVWVAVGGGSPLTTKGDLYTFSTTDARLAVGADGTTLVADSIEATGLKWASASVPANSSATIATSQATSSTSYTDLTTPGPAVTVTTGTKALVIVSAFIDGGFDSQARMSFEVSGATTTAVSDDWALGCYGTGVFSTGIMVRASRATSTTLTAGSNTFTTKYRTSTNASTFANREIFVINLA
jgi:hypothetical protein